MLLFYRSHDPFLHSKWASGESARTADEHGAEANEEEVQATNIRGRIEGAYQDDPPAKVDERCRRTLLNEAASNRKDNQGPVMQPSSLDNGDNEWRGI